VAQERQRRLAAWSQAHPGEPPPPHLGEIDPDEVPRPFPITAVVLGFDVLVFGWAMTRRRQKGDSPAPPVRWSWALGAAALALALCAWLL
jgi:hypothetical protein